MAVNLLWLLLDSFGVSAQIHVVFLCSLLSNCQGFASCRLFHSLVVTN